MVKKRFSEPFDDRFVSIMDKVAMELCSKVQGARIAYVQSDEISLLVAKSRPESDVFFGGRLCKMQSVIASMATAVFMREFMDIWDREEELPLFNFDCKAWNVENLKDAMAWFLYRSIDCVRNSKNQTAGAFLTHRELLNHTSDEKIELLRQKMKIDWNAFPDGWKYGRVLTCETVEHQENSRIFERGTWTVRDGMDLTQPENWGTFAEYLKREA